MICRECRIVQKNVNKKYLEEINTIYADYQAYHQSSAIDQVVFDESGQHLQTRSMSILKEIEKRISIPDYGRYLDVGCADGNMLHAFSKVFPGWDLYGFDLDENKKNRIESMENVLEYYSTDINCVQGEYDLISMVHVLEHVIDPLIYLKKIAVRLKKDGMLVIEVPDILANPFDLLIADHCSHFTKETLAGLLEKAGYSVIFSSNRVIPKEITIIAKPVEEGPVQNRPKKEVDMIGYLFQSLDWLKDLRNQTQLLADKGELGVFGSGIASVWLIAELEGRIKFCVDEDKNKLNRTYCNVSVFHPDSIHGKQVIVPFPYEFSEKIVARLSGHNQCRYIGPRKLRSVDRNPVDHQNRICQKGES